MYYLITHSPCPPGEFFIGVRFVDGVETITEAVGSQADGFRKFGPWPQIEMVADELVAFRKANGIAGANRALAISQIDQFTCQRLGNAKRWCSSTDKEYAAVGASPQRVASGGGCCGRAST
jgi:hypothetical protein